MSEEEDEENSLRTFKTYLYFTVYLSAAANRIELYIFRIIYIYFILPLGKEMD